MLTILGGEEKFQDNVQEGPGIHQDSGIPTPEGFPSNLNNKEINIFTRQFKLFYSCLATEAGQFRNGRLYAKLQPSKAGHFQFYLVERDQICPMKSIKGGFAHSNKITLNKSISSIFRRGLMFTRQFSAKNSISAAEN